MARRLADQFSNLGPVQPKIGKLPIGQLHQLTDFNPPAMPGPDRLSKTLQRHRFRLSLDVFLAVSPLVRIRRSSGSSIRIVDR